MRIPPANREPARARVTGNAIADSRALLLEPEVKRSRVRLLATIVLVGTVTSIVWHYMSGFYFGLGYPQSTFLFRPTDYFNDWRTDYIYAQDYLRGTSQGFAYFPFAVLTVAVATIAPMTVGFVLVIAQFLAAFVLMLRRSATSAIVSAVDNKSPAPASAGATGTSWRGVASLVINLH